MKGRRKAAPAETARRVTARRLSTTRRFSGRIIRLDQDEVRLPNGHRLTLDIVRHPGAAAIVPLLADGAVVLVRQYRWAALDFIYEVPAGTLDRGERPDRCARREIEEETGYRAGRLHALGSILTTPGFTDEVIHIYAATDLESTRQALGQDEVIDVVKVPFATALRMIAEGRIRDAKSICALLRADQEMRAGRLSARPARARAVPRRRKTATP